MRVPLLLLLCFAPVASAQFPVFAPGTIRRLEGSSPCQLAETHYLECTSISLKSSRVDLYALEGQVHQVFGATLGGSCHGIDVAGTALLPPLTWSGDARPGGQVTFDQCSGAGYMVALFISPLSGYYPPLLLDHPIVELGRRLQCQSFVIPIPAHPALSGQTAYFQAFVGYVGPPPAQGNFLTNSVCVTVQ